MSAYRLLAFSAAILVDFYLLYHNSIRTTRKLKLLHQILELIPTKPSDIIEKLKTNQVLILKADTCSGKSTQTIQYLCDATFADESKGTLSSRILILTSNYHA